ncbi:MAG TPA: DcaP family trimeric outer membrane transporter [Gemmatimonadales bacterium]|nr:DcaP family trimeric outer membrane transporter [Gemmatimonadales bacterium]
MRCAALVSLVVSSLAPQAGAQDAKARVELYGHIMTDAGINGTVGNPLYFDVLRTSRLPSFQDEFGPGPSTFFSVRQTRLGIKAGIPTSLGEVKTTFEFELFGAGTDAGETTFHLRHAYAELGKFGVGQYWSPFTDIDGFPNSVEYWGPTGMAIFRNIQIRYMPIQGDSRLTIALERPGASGDGGIYADRIELQDVNPRFPLPDLSAEYRKATRWGYIELAGIVRYIKWDDLGNDPLDLEGDATGWGLNLSSNIKLNSSNTAHLQLAYGEGVENYMNDSPADVGIEPNPGGGSLSPVRGVALPVLGVTAFLDHTWSPKFSSAIGYSMQDIDNSENQSPSAFSKGQYALGNLLYTPVPGVMTGVEVQWGDRENFSDGFNSSTVRVQLSFKYNYSKVF